MVNSNVFLKFSMGVSKTLNDYIIMKFKRTALLVYQSGVLLARLCKNNAFLVRSNVVIITSQSRLDELNNVYLAFIRN